jgi:cytochrome P450
MTDMDALREVEIEWLAGELGRSIANLGYPVGCGVPPSPEHLQKAAETLFARYAKMIEMARANAAKPILTHLMTARTRLKCDDPKAALDLVRICIKLIEPVAQSPQGTSEARHD